MASDPGQDNDRPPTLWQRVEALEDAMFGTREDEFRDGVKPQLRRLRSQLTFWGAVLTAVILASGALNGKGGEVIGAVIKGITG